MTLFHDHVGQTTNQVVVVGAFVEYGERWVTCRYTACFRQVNIIPNAETLQEVLKESMVGHQLESRLVHKSEPTSILPSFGMNPSRDWRWNFSVPSSTRKSPGQRNRRPKVSMNTCPIQRWTANWSSWKREDSNHCPMLSLPKIVAIYGRSREDVFQRLPASFNYRVFCLTSSSNCS